MLRRRFVTTTFGGNSSFFLSSKRFCSSSILPDHQNSSNVNNNTQGKANHHLSKEQILGERWRCSNFVQQQKSEVPSSSSSSSSKTDQTTHHKDEEPRWTPSSSTGTGILSSAFRGLVNKITRRDEMEEEDEIRRIAEAKSKLKKKQQQNTNTVDDSSSADSHQLPTLEDLKINRSPDIEAIDEFGNVNWGIYERLDVSIRWVSPLDWNVNTRVSENFVAIQCVPPPPQLEMDESEFSSSNNSSLSNSNNQQEQKQNSSSSSTPSIHGLSVSNFVYLSKVPPQVSANDLLKQFLTQFHRSVGRSSVVVASSTFTEDQITPANHDSCAMCREIVELSGFDVQQQSTSSTSSTSNDEKLKTDPKTGKPIPKTACAVCELVFKPPNASSGSNNNQQKSSQMNQQPQQARALCKVFFHRSRKRHTVVVFAVPDDEWNQVKELVKHAVLCVGELHHHPTGKMNY